MSKNIKGITIEIGASTTGLDKALKDVNKQSRDIQKELRQVDKLLKFNPKNTELISQKQKLLGDQVSVTRDKLDKLKQAEAQVQEQFKKGEITEEQYRAYQREIVETESKLKHYENQLKEVTKANSSFSKKMEEVSVKLKDIGEKVKNTGKTLTKGLTAPIMAIGGASVIAFKEVDEALDTIVTKTGATGKAMEGFEKSFNKVASKMPVGLQSVGDAIGEVNTQFGFTGDKLEKASEQMIKFAEINGQDVTSSSIASKNAIEAFELSVEELDMVLDSVTKTAQNTGVGTDKLFDSVIKGAPQLKALNLDFSQATEIMGRFEQKGIESTKALSYMTRAQVTFAKEGKTLDKGLEGLIKKIENSKSETEKLSIASKYFGTKGATFMLDAINRGALDFKDFEDAAKSVSGTVSETFEGTLDPIDNFKIAMNNAKLVGSDISATAQKLLAPSLEKVVEKLQKATEWFKNLSPGVQENIVKIGALAAALGPALFLIGNMTIAIGASVSAIGKMTAAFKLLSVAKIKDKMETITLTGLYVKDKIAKIASAVATGTMTAATATWNIVAGIATTVTKALGASIAFLTSPIGIAIIAITAIIAAGVALYKNWDTVKEKASSLFKSVSTTFSNLKTGIERPMNAAKDAVGRAIEKIKSMFNFEFKWPKLKMPEFSIKGSMNPVKWLTDGVPKLSVNWNADGGIFTRPTVLPTLAGLQGFAEPRTSGEAIMPLNKLPSLMAQAMKLAGKTGDTIIYINNPQPNPSELARQIKKQQQDLAMGW